jgi:signal transduction histidine kinase
VAALHATVEVLSDYAVLSRAEIGDLVGRLQRGLTWLEGMVENLTASSVAESGHVSLRRDVVDMMACVDTAVAVVEPLVIGRRQQITVRSGRSRTGTSAGSTGGARRPVPVYGDGEKITQVLINLLMNACSYTPDGSAIEVAIRRAGCDVEARVTDSGPGVSEAERATIFGRFARGRAGSDRPAGLGLGLHIVKTLVELQGGSVGVDSPPGRGASFWFTLPGAPGGKTGRAPLAHPGGRRRTATSPAAAPRRPGRSR